MAFWNRVIVIAPVSLLGGSMAFGAGGPTFQAIGLMAGSSVSQVEALSGDGNVVVGTATSSGGDTVLFRWTLSSGFEALPGLTPSLPARAFGTNWDGSAVVGWQTTATGDRPVLWRASTGTQILHLDDPTSFRGLALSGDGNSISGYQGPLSSTHTAFRWSSTSGMVPLQQLSGYGNSTAPGLNWDGSVTVGSCNQPLSGTTPSSVAVTWNAAGAVSMLGMPASATGTVATVTNSSASAIAGYGFFPDANALCLWDSNRVPTVLGWVGRGYTPQPFGISNDGGIVVGRLLQGSTLTSTAFIWTRDTGFGT